MVRFTVMRFTTARPAKARSRKARFSGMRHAALAVALLVAGMPSATQACDARSGASVLPLVELYTAEGCNDCPPADRWLSGFARGTPPTRAAALAFHVDYWDDQGWPDRFGTALNSQRQELRVRLAKQQVTYTPQVMVGSEVMVKWNRPASLESVLSKARARKAPLDLTLHVGAVADGELDVDVRAAPGAGDAGPALVWLALYQDGLSTDVGAGENKGATLHHDHVVRALAGPWQAGAEPFATRARVRLPPQARREDLGLVLFAESRASGEALQALALPLSACPPPS